MKGTDSGSLPTISRSAAEDWLRTVTLTQIQPVLFGRPTPSDEIVVKTSTNFRTLLLETYGVLFEDNRVRIELAGVSVVARDHASSRPGLLFELVVTNAGTNVMQEIALVPLEPSRTHACELFLKAQPVEQASQCQSGVLRRGQSLRFAGRLDAFGPFEVVPSVSLSFFLPDGMTCQLLLRLPLPLTRLMVCGVAARVLPGQLEIVKLWSSDDFVHSEVAFCCSVRPDLLGQGAPFTIWRCLELRGAFRILAGFDDNPRGALLLSLYPQRQGSPREVLLRAELGGSSGPGGTPYRISGTSLPSAESSVIRIVVRSASHLVNRAVAQVALEVLCDTSAHVGRGALLDIPLASLAVEHS